LEHEHVRLFRLPRLLSGSAIMARRRPASPSTTPGGAVARRQARPWRGLLPSRGGGMGAHNGGVGGRPVQARQRPTSPASPSSPVSLSREASCDCERARPAREQHWQILYRPSSSVLRTLLVCLGTRVPVICALDMYLEICAFVSGQADFIGAVISCVLYVYRYSRCT